MHRGPRIGRETARRSDHWPPASRLCNTAAGDYGRRAPSSWRRRSGPSCGSNTFQTDAGATWLYSTAPGVCVHHGTPTGRGTAQRSNLSPPASRLFNTTAGGYGRRAPSGCSSNTLQTVHSAAASQSGALCGCLIRVLSPPLHPPYQQQGFEPCRYACIWRVGSSDIAYRLALQSFSLVTLLAYGL